MSSFFNAEIAKLAVELTLPAILETMRRKIGTRETLHITILEPSIASPGSVSSGSIRGGVILYEHSLKEELWADIGRDFKAYAQSKARVSWRLGKDSHVIREQSPWLFDTNDMMYGGAVNLDGLVVAVSGDSKWQIDEMYAGMIAQMCKGLCRLTIANALAVTATPVDWHAPVSPTQFMPPATK